MGGVLLRTFISSEMGNKIKKLFWAPSEHLDNFLNSTTGKQIMFNFSVGYVTYTIYLLNAKPQYYWLLHTILTAVFPIQYFLYRKEGWHYFMLEFCYSVSVFQMLFALWALSLYMGYSLPLGDRVLTPVRWFYDGQMTMRVFYLLASGPVA